MTEAEASETMKRKCKVLADFFTDSELVGFLNDYAVTSDTETTYDIRRSIYDALTSALTVMEQSTTRGGVTTSYADLFKIRRQFATAGVVSCARS